MRLDLKWQALLADGGMVTEEDIPYADLFTKNFALTEFRLVDHYPWKNAKTGEVLPSRLFLTVALSPGRRLIYRKRTEVDATAASSGAEETDRRRTIIVGWQETESGVNSQCILLVQEWNGAITMLPRFRAGEEIDLRQWEKDAGIDPGDLEAPDA